MKTPPILIVMLAIMALAFFNPFSLGLVLPVLFLVFIPQKPIRNLSTGDVRKASNALLERSRRRARYAAILLIALIGTSALAYPAAAGSQPGLMFTLGLAAGSLFSLALIAGFYDLYRSEARRREQERIRKRFYKG
jgi:hypothetical protein